MGKSLEIRQRLNINTYSFGRSKPSRTKLSMLYPNKQYTNESVIGPSGIRTHDPWGTANFDSCINENVGKSFSVLHVLSSLNEQD